MKPVRPRARGWSLGQDAFDRLLSYLDADRERAGESYERIRRKLTSFFRWRGCTVPDEYVDRTIDRVARRISEGAHLHVTDPYVYFHGVALNVLSEYWRAPRSEAEIVQATAPDRSADADDERDRRERRLECLDSCLARLPIESRQLLRDYHPPGTGSAIAARRALASGFGIPLNALRIRAHRLRTTLQSCITSCLAQTK